MKSVKMPHIINADLGSLIRKIDGCENSLEKFSTTKTDEHNSCGHSILTI